MNEKITNCPGIYKIETRHNNKFYFGSAKNLQRRKRDHFYCLKTNRHDNPMLQAAYNKHGKNNFIFEIILTCDTKHILFFEQKFLDKYFDNQKQCYNICPTAGNCLGRKFSEETKKKMSMKRKGLLKGDKHPFYGRALPEETKEKLRQANLGKTPSAETIEKRKISLKKSWDGNPDRRKRASEQMSGKNNSFYGKKHTKESREKISLNRKGKTSGDKHPMFNKKHPKGGKKHHNYDHVIYTFFNKKQNITEKLTQNNFRIKYKLKQSSTSSLVSGKIKSLFDWIILKT